MQAAVLELKEDVRVKRVHLIRGGNNSARIIIYGGKYLAVTYQEDVQHCQ
jgi:hypothetical protein